MNKKFVIIGGGPAGYGLAMEAVKTGCEVTLIEKEKLGGVCLNYGCIPVKSMLKNLETLPRLEVLEPQAWKRMLQDIYGRVKLLQNGMRRSLIRKGVEIIGKAVDAGDIMKAADAGIIQNIEISKTATEDASQAVHVLAIGRSQWKLPEVPGKKLYDCRTIMDMTELPESLAIIGGGVSGIEFAQIFAFLGVRVTVYEKEDRILASFSEEMAQRYQEILFSYGIEFVTGFSGEWQEIPEESMLFAVTGSADVLDDQTIEWLQAAGIEADAQGIAVNENWECSRPGFYAIGDCTGRTTTAYEAEMAARQLMKHLMLQSGENCLIHKTEENHPLFGADNSNLVQEVTAASLRVVSGKLDLVELGEKAEVWAESHGSDQAFCFMMNATESYVRLYADMDGRLKGASYMLPNGAEFTGMLTSMIEARMHVRDLARGTWFHPASSECFRNAAVKLDEILNS